MMKNDMKLSEQFEEFFFLTKKGISASFNLDKLDLFSNLSVQCIEGTKLKFSKFSCTFPHSNGTLYSKFGYEAIFKATVKFMVSRNYPIPCRYVPLKIHLQFCIYFIPKNVFQKGLKNSVSWLLGFRLIW